jgi:hypothetical protein
MILDADALYALIPPVYREQDAALGVEGGPGPLREIIEIVAAQLGLIDAEVDQLYDDAFIETCNTWVVPYIGDLVGYTPLNASINARLSPRAEVANTIRYRRWKGTATILEQLATDVTGWSAVAVEFFQKLRMTQFVNHVRLDSLGTVDVRNADVASSVGTPFDATAHRVDVRSIRSRRGRYNIPNVGVFVWRLGAFANSDNPSDARRVDDGHYLFDPLGFDVPLVNLPAERPPFTRTQPGDVPAPLSRRGLAASGPPFDFSIAVASATPIPAADVDICDLSAWNTPAGTPQLTGGYTVAVDPQLGRIWFPPGKVGANTPVLVTYAYAFSGGYGAGFYQRALQGMPTLSVTRDPGTLTTTMTLAGAFNSALGMTANPIVEYADNVTDASASTTLTIANGQAVTIRAADTRRPVLTGPLTIDSTVDLNRSATLVLDGFALGGGISVIGQPQGTLVLILRRCTIAAGPSGNAIYWNNGPQGTVTVEQSLCGPIVVDAAVVDVAISNSVVDAGTGVALSAGTATIDRSTVFGSASVDAIALVENAIVTGPVTSLRTQSGCVRFSYLPLSSQVPQRYRCQPDSAAEAAIAAAAAADPSLSQTQLTAIGHVAAEQTVPQFSSIDAGTPAYAQLSSWTPREIAAGAEDDGEMGVYHDLFNGLREANLLYRLDENLRIGLEAGVLHAS